MAQADLSKSVFTNDPRADALVPDIYAEESVKSFLENIVPEEGFSLASVFGDIPSDVLSLGPSKELLGLGKKIKGNFDKVVSGNATGDILETLRILKSNIPPNAKMDKLLASFDLMTLTEGLVNLKSILSPSRWIAIGNEFIEGAFENLNYLAESLGIDCLFCKGKCGALGNSYGGNYPDSEYWQGAVLLTDLEDMLRCFLIDQALGLVDSLSGGLLSDGTVGKILSKATRLAASIQRLDIVKEWIDKAGEFFGSDDRDKVTRSIMEGYKLDRDKKPSELEAESVRLAKELTALNPNWYYQNTSVGRVLSTKYMGAVSKDFIKVMSFHPEYWPISVVDQSFNPLTKPWKEVAIEQFPMIKFHDS